jgi:branched-chain amino acid transport system permease protein
MVVFRGLGNIWGSVIAAAVIRLLPELLRSMKDYRMLIYAVILILVMIATNNPAFKSFLARFIPKKKGAEIDG